MKILSKEKREYLQRYICKKRNRTKRYTNIQSQSHDQCQDIIMAIEASLPIGTHIEDLREFKKGTCNKDKHASIEGAFLHILTIDLILNVLETKRFNFVLDLCNAFVDTAIVTHSAVLSIEAEQVCSILHESAIVSFQELFGKSFHSNVVNLKQIIIEQCTLLLQSNIQDLSIKYGNHELICYSTEFLKIALENKTVIIYFLLSYILQFASFPILEIPYSCQIAEISVPLAVSISIFVLPFQSQLVNRYRLGYEYNAIRELLVHLMQELKNSRQQIAGDRDIVSQIIVIGNY